MNIFGIGLPEMALIMMVALLVFGPKKLPEIGRSLGKAIKGFQDASKEFEDEFKKEAERLEKTVTEPIKATLETPEPKALQPETADSEGASDTATATETATDETA
ncbi:MAG: TatA/E family twin arginine-targeting protein translocase [Cyanobacteria bacterium P01_D01_bin.156]